MNHLDKTWQLIKHQCLRELARRDVEIPSRWSTRRIYDELVAEGLAVGGVASNFTHKYIITAKGRKEVIK